MMETDRNSGMMSGLQNNLKFYHWKEIVDWARENSPFYRELYHGLFPVEKLSDLPIVNQDDFWKANTIQNNRVLTSSTLDGIVFKSGGTTGNPKFSVFTREEWNDMVHLFGEGMSQAGISKGDRVGNLFYVGDLYGSFIFIMRSLESGPIPVLQFPIGGGTPLDTILKTVNDFQINVLVGPPTTLLSAAAYYLENRFLYPDIRIDKALYGGESIYSDQREQLLTAFPGVKILSVGYASVDAGLLGYAAKDCQLDEHRVFASSVILEIVDEETGQPIEEVGHPGKLTATSLTRRLMPIIRYPVGDRAEWKEPFSEEKKDRKFLLLGRSDDAARIGPLSVYYEDMREIIAAANTGVPITAFQLVVRHSNKKDGLIVRMAILPEDLQDRALGSQESRGKVQESRESSGRASKKLDKAWKKILNLFNQERSAYLQAVERDLIYPMAVEWTTSDQMEINLRTGKLKRVIDQRR